MRTATDEDHHCIVLGNIEVASQELKQWVELLTRNDKQLEQEFRQLYETKGTVLSAITHLRRQLFAEGRGKVCIDLILSAYKNERWELMRSLTEEIFLEPISLGYLKTLLKVREKNEWTFKDVLDIHNEYNEKRIWQIICSKNKKAIDDAGYAVNH